MSSSRCLPADWIRCRSAIDAGLAVVFRLFLEQLAVENDGVQRRAQLVAHAGEELALGAGRRFGLPLRDAQLIDQRRQLLRVLPLRLVRGLQSRRVAASSRSFACAP